MSQMTQLIDSSVEEEVWAPAFAYAASTTQMPYLEGAANRKPVLGFNQFFVLSNPSFKDMSIENNIKVGVDWFLNDVLNSDITPNNGVMFWYKKRGERSSTSTLENMAVGEWIYASTAFNVKSINNKTLSIPAGQICVKLNNKELQVLPINKITKGNQQISRAIYLHKSVASDPEPYNPLGTQNNIYEPTKINLETSTNKPSSWSLYEDYNYLNVNGSYYSIHISEGDYFSYFNSSNQTDHFLSFNLMPIYRTIYNNLLNITGLSSLSSQQAKKLRELAYVLATGPQNDKVTFNVNGYNPTSYISSITSYINSSTYSVTDVQNICKNIYKEIKDLEKNRTYNTSLVPYKINLSDLNDNFSKVPNDIFHKLVSKYGLYLRLAGDNAKITVNKLLRWKESKKSNNYVGGPNISIDARFIYWTSNRDITNEAVSRPTPGNVGHPYYDQHIQAGPMKIETDVGNQVVYFKSVETGSEQATIKAGIIKPSQNPRINTSESSYLLLPEIKYCMFYKQGGFKIISSTCYIDENVGQASMYNGKLDGKPIFLKIDKLSSKWNSGTNKEYNFDNSDPDEYKKPSIKFKIYNSNDVIKIDSLYINFIRYKEDTLCQCESFYKEIINRSENYTKEIGVNRFLGIDIFEQTPKRVGFGRAGYCDNVYLGRVKNMVAGVEIEETSSAGVPGVSTRFAPPILAYGGYDASIVSELGVKLPSHPMPGEKLPTLNTRNPNYIDETKCYERSGFVQDSSYFTHTSDNSSSDNLIGSTVFEKGFFHPHKGWISEANSLYNNFKNKTAVTSYKPHKKSRFVFKGVGFLFDSDLSYSSTISINKGSQKTTIDEFSPQTAIRDIGSFLSKYSSEYITEECIPYKGKRDENGKFINNTEQFKDNSCDNNYQPKVEHLIYPLKDAATGVEIVPTADIDNLRIKDIEVKLNFINFDNIQDIKLTLKYTGTAGTDTRPSSYYGMVSSSPFPSAETGVNNYINALISQHPSDTIILLNKEHIKQYGSEFVLRFSDYADPHTFGNPTNGGTEISHSALLNNGLSDGGVIHPSFKPDGYTDQQAQLYREILNNYNVCIINNKFRKWYGSQLIGSKFVLEVELVNKYTKNNYGNIKDLHLKNNKEYDLLKSNIARNSICNWELIIDTYKTTDAAHRKEQRLNINHPAAEHIDYTRTDTSVNATGSSYSDGYNFLGDFTDRKFMIPPVNMNAPHQYLIDYNSCVYPDRTLNNFGFSRLEENGLRYIYQAFNLFSMGIGAAVGFAAAGGLTGAFVGGTLFGTASSLAVSSIVNYFGSLRRTRLVDAYDNSFYDPYYDDYGYGVPDRALVEISTDGGYKWYTFDAKIFKYNQTCSPIYKPLTVTYTGAGDSSKDTCSKLSVSTAPDTPSESDPIKIDPDTFYMPESFIFTGKYIKAKELYIRKNIKLLDSRPNISNISNLFIGQNTYDKDSTVCIELPNVKPFYYLKSGTTTISESIDLIHYDSTGFGYRNKRTITANNIAVLNKDNQYNTYILLNDLDFKNKLEKYPNTKIIAQKTNASNRLAVILNNGGNYLTLASIKNNSSNIFTPDYTMPVYGEGAWGRGTASIQLMPAKKIAFAADYDLSNYAIGYSHNRYVGRLHIKGPTSSSVVSTSYLNIGLFDNVNGWPLYKNLDKYNLYPNLSDNTNYPYKGISDLNSIFCLYTNTEISGLKNSELNYGGSITLLDHLIQAPVGSNENANLAGYRVEAIYSANQIEGSSCWGGHYCDRAKFNIYINGVFLFVANLNNETQGSAPNPPLDNGVGLDSSDRYAFHIITEEEASEIARVSTEDITISYSPTADNTNPHSNITWIRVLTPEGQEVTSTCADNTGLSTKILPYDDNKYWISIDKDQYGSYSRTTSIKVLDKIEYSCSEPRTMPGGLNCKNICGISRNYGSTIGVGDDGVTWTPNITTPLEIMKVQAKSTAFDQIIAQSDTPATAIFTNVQADAHKAAIATKYPQVQWTKLIISRPDVRVSCGNSNGDTVMFIKEHYWIPKNTDGDSSSYATLGVKASTILDSASNIMVRFRYNTRKLRHVDNFLKKYIISPNGSVAYGGIGGTDELPIKNSFYSWFCNYIDRGTNTLNTVVPPYYMMLNEMIFRGFFGSADGLEFKTSTLKTQYPHEWIPYEYDNSITCNNSEFEDSVFIAGLHNLDKLGYRLRCWLLSKLVDTPYDKKKIVSRCLAYMQNLGGPGIVPDKKTFDRLYETKDPQLNTLRQTFMG
jgi:hypothetical protein